MSLGGEVGGGHDGCGSGIEATDGDTRPDPVQARHQNDATAGVEMQRTLKERTHTNCIGIRTTTDDPSFPADRILDFEDVRSTEVS